MPPSSLPNSIFTHSRSLSWLDRVRQALPHDRGTFKVWIKGIVEGLWRESPPICLNVKDWADTQPDSIAELVYAFYANGETRDRSLPQTLERSIDPLFLSSQHQVPVEKYLVKLSQAQLIGNSGVVILPDGRYTQEPAISEYHLKQLAEYYSGLRHRFLKRRTLKGNYFVLMQLWSSASNYYHTIHDNVHRLYGLLAHLPKDILFIVPEGLRGWQSEVLSVLGIGVDRRVMMPTTEIWTVESLYFSPHGAPWDFDTPMGYQWGQQRFYEHYGVVPKPPSKLLYISRELASWRKLSNEPEVEKLLASYGFEKCLPETLTIGEQVQLFAQARAVVSVKGAALTNLMFCGAGTQVLEILMQEYDPLGPCFWFMCEHLDHTYAYLVGEAIKNDPWLDRKQQERLAYLSIPLDQLERSIQALLARL